MIAHLIHLDRLHTMTDILKRLEYTCAVKSNHECDYVISKDDYCDQNTITHYVITKITTDDYETIGFWLDEAYPEALVFPKGSFLYGLENSDFCEIKQDWNEVIEDLFQSFLSGSGNSVDMDKNDAGMDDSFDLF